MTRKLPPVLVVVLATALAAAALQPSAGAQPGAVRVVDRTLLCSTGIQGGARVIHVSARSAFGKGVRLDWMGQVVVTTPGQPIPTKPGYQPNLAGVVAGWPPPQGITAGGLGFATKLCRPTSARVGFSRRGLIGFPADQLGDEYTCRVQRTLLVRVRAVFRAPVALELSKDRLSRTAIGRIEAGQVAVRSLAGKPLVFGEVADSGRARLFTGGSCN